MGGNIMKTIIVSFALLLCVTTLNAYAENDWASDGKVYNNAYAKNPDPTWVAGGSIIPIGGAIPTATNKPENRIIIGFSAGSAAPAGIDQKTWDAMIKALPGDPSKAGTLTPTSAVKSLANAKIVSIDGTNTDNLRTGTIITNFSAGSAAPAGLDQKTWDAMIKALPGDPSKSVALTPTSTAPRSTNVNIISIDGTNPSNYPVKQMGSISYCGTFTNTDKKVTKETR
jgi:hypothetical protein